MWDMTDGQLVQIAAQIYRHNEKIRDLLRSAERHPSGESFLEDLQEEGCGYSVDVAKVVHDCLRSPWQWEEVGGGKLRWIGRKPQ